MPDDLIAYVAYTRLALFRKIKERFNVEMFIIKIHSFVYVLYCVEDGRHCIRFIGPTKTKKYKMPSYF